MSRTVLAVSPAAQMFTGPSNRRPAHQWGYFARQMQCRLERARFTLADAIPGDEGACAMLGASGEEL